MSESKSLIFDLQPTHLGNELITLVPLTNNDFEKLFSVASDPLIWEQHPTKNRYEREVFENFFKGAIESKGAFIILDTKTNDLLGSSRFYEPNSLSNSVNIGYTFLARHCWGKNYNRDLKTLMINHALKFVDNIHFHIGETNFRSQKAIEKFGAKKIGAQEMAYSGEPVANNNFIYEINKTNWHNKKNDRYKITFETWDKVASIYQDKFMNLDLYNDTYDIFCSRIKKPNARILEIGCGPGNITKYLLSKHPDFKLEAIDVSINMITLAKENNPTANFKIMDAREIEKLAGKYDAIMCGFCLPYLSKEDCVKLFKDCSSLLSEGGIFYLSTIEGDYNKSGLEAGSSGDKAYVYYYEEDYLQNELKNNNFKLVELIKKDYPEKSSTHLIFIVRKK